jgi:hypothetical protein
MTDHDPFAPKEYNHTAKTPPMGFNTWDCYGAGVDEKNFLANAKVLAEKLKPHGYQYAVVDIQWYEPTADSAAYHPFADLCMDEYSRLIPAPNRFPSAKNGWGFQKLADEIHAMGLKFGIHILRGVPRQAVHRNSPTVTPGVTARDIAAPYSVCPWNTDMYGVDADKPGAREYYESVFALFAEWGVDYVKVDDIANTEFLKDNPYSAAKEIELMRDAIDKCGRSIVLSLSPGPAPIAHARHLSANADLWRMSGDFWDRSNALDRMFGLCAQWYPHVGQGSWPDCDMLPLGVLQLTEKDPAYRARRTRFTPHEQKTVMNLWCVFRSPLMMGGELTLLDEDTLSLLTNRELLALDQYGSGARPLVSDAEKAVWTCFDRDGNAVYAFFNLLHAPQTLGFDFGAPAALYDLWSGETLPLADGALRLPLQARESRVFRIVHK